jgi:hypothetical protein
MIAQVRPRCANELHAVTGAQPADLERRAISIIVRSPGQIPREAQTLRQTPTGPALTANLYVACLLDPPAPGAASRVAVNPVQQASAPQSRPVQPAPTVVPPRPSQPNAPANTATTAPQPIVRPNFPFAPLPAANLDGEWRGDTSGNRVRITMQAGGYYVAAVTQNAGQSQGAFYRQTSTGEYRYTFPDGKESIARVGTDGTMRITNPDGWTDLFRKVSN